MKPVSAAAMLAATTLWLSALFAVSPFDRVNAALDRAFGALPAWTQIESGGMLQDPTIAELSHGEHPLESFAILARTWAAHPESGERVILMGNSQTQMTSLSAGEPPPRGPEKAYPDLIAEAYRQDRPQKLFYRLGAGALSYEEMLWYASYLTLHPEIRPTVLVAQLNYQNLANGGIREGMLELLQDGNFRRKAEAIAASRRADAESFAAALRRRDENLAQTQQARNDTAPRTIGDRLETGTRAVLDRIPGFTARPELKTSFVYTLLRSRSYFLHIEVATRRSLGGARVEASRAALEDLAELCRESGIRLILFQAPTNPAVPLYRTAEDDRSYHAFADGLAARYGLTLLDFENSIPRQNWGMALNVPDPLHLSREGHRQFARLLLEALAEHGV